jgi:mRNA interferase ChpB
MDRRPRRRPRGDLNTMSRIPDRGEIWFTDLDPARGKEQQGKRPVLVLTQRGFNAKGLMLVCPISQGARWARDEGFVVSLQGSGTQTQGVVLCHQSRTVDFVERQASRVEAAPSFVVDEVLDRVAALLE